jgi:3-oxoacyl-[acyl-carrier-protein] synthase II
VKRRVAVTGAGILCALGDGCDTVWKNLLSGICGVKPLTRFPAGDMRSPMCAEVAPFEEPGCEGVGFADTMAIHTAREALSSAGLASLPPGSGVAVGTGVSGLPESEEAYLAHLSGASLAPAMRPFARHLPATAADLLAARFGADGPLLSVVNACSSSTVAIGQAGEWVASGECECALAGASDALSRLTMGGFNILRVVSRDRPRPFDKNRSGMVIGEGGAFLVLEALDRAVARGACILATLDGMGLSCDALHATAPDTEGRGALAALRQCLDKSGTPVGELDHINAHGTGTGPNDKAEGAAIRALLRERADEVPVISVKGAMGHCLGAAGALEAVITVLSLSHQTVPPSVGFQEADPDIPLHVPRAPIAMPLRKAISLSLAFGGNNAAILFGRAP